LSGTDIETLYDWVRDEAVASTTRVLEICRRRIHGAIQNDP
jgi:hypothetical protein